MESILAMNVQTVAIQSMETLYILATSRNIDTIKGRHEFLLTIIRKTGQVLFLVFGQPLCYLR